MTNRIGKKKRENQTRIGKKHRGENAPKNRVGKKKKAFHRRVMDAIKRGVGLGIKHATKVHEGAKSAHHMAESVVGLTEAFTGRKSVRGRAALNTMGTHVARVGAANQALKRAHKRTTQVMDVNTPHPQKQAILRAMAKDAGNVSRHIAGMARTAASQIKPTNFRPIRK